MSILIQKVRLQNEVVDVLIKENKFHSIGTDIDTHADIVIDGTDKAILPSLHNCHTHAAMTLLRGYADDLELHTWLKEYIWPFEARLTEEDVYWGSKLACLEMIKSGTTFFADMYWHLPGTARAVEEMGIRAALSAAFFDFEDPEKALTMQKQVMRLHELSTSFSERIQFILGPHAIYTVSTDSLRWLANYAAKHNLLIHTHLSETQKEVADCVQAHGKRPVTYLHDLGLLSSNLILAHGIWLDDQEMNLLAQHGVHIVHCPVSNMKLCSGQFDYKAMCDHGIKVALGTDGCSSNNSLDMFGEMKTASLLAKISSMDPTILPAQEVFAAATLVGAHMYNLESGCIVTGQWADCILVDVNQVSMIPDHNLISNMVFSAGACAVDTTICNGQVLMQGGIVPGEEEIKDRVREIIVRLTQTTSAGLASCS
ncbi:MAG: amidohydrolase [Desulfovibrionales bacterium]|nr:amidohydrolase [Desulfovibrionales bacterium]